MMRIYFVRHGERDDRPELYTGEQIPLTENGKRQALLLGERFSAIPVDAIYCSPYVRTKQTAEIINTITKTTIYYDDLLKELGETEGNAAVFRRAMAFVQFLEKHMEGKCILVSAHAGIIKMIIFAMVFGEPLLAHAFNEFNASYHMDFTGVTLCRYEGAPPWLVVTWNDLGHLPPPA